MTEKERDIVEGYAGYTKRSYKEGYRMGYSFGVDRDLDPTIPKRLQYIQEYPDGKAFKYHLGFVDGFFDQAGFDD